MGARGAGYALGKRSTTRTSGVGVGLAVLITAIGRASETDSAWDFASVIRGDGVSACSWVGGSDPAPAVIAQDAAASAWAVALSISGASIVVTVTGEVGSTIDWMSTIELDEVV
jgi:hypothetical protein